MILIGFSKALGRLRRNREGWSSLTARSVAEENVCNCVGDGQAWRAFEPEEFAAWVEFEKYVSALGCQDDVDGAVVQREVVHEAKDFLFDLKGELIGPPVLNHAEAVAAPVVRGAGRDLRVEGGGHDAAADDRDAKLKRLGE